MKHNLISIIVPVVIIHNGVNYRLVVRENLLLFLLMYHYDNC